MAAEDKTTVTVGCKLPHGMHLDIYNTEAKTPEERAVVLERHTIKGANASEVIGGHGITVGVPRAFWEQWLKLNKDTAPVKNELIWAHERADSAVAKAQERKDTVTGFEGLNPDKPGQGVERAPENNARK